jgi:hypothetical protein
MSRRTLLIGAIAVIVVVITIGVVSIATRPEPQMLELPSPQTEPQEQATTETPTGETEEDHEEHGGDYHGATYEGEVLDSMFLNGRQAVLTYVQQPQGETKQERKNRLSPYFAPDSIVPTGNPPKTAEGYFTQSVIILEANWILPKDPSNVAIIVYLKVNINTSFDSYEEHQTWITELVEQSDGAWLTKTIYPSNLPYIEAQ